MKKLILLLLLLPILVKAENIIWSTDHNQLKIGNKVEVLEDPGGNFTFEEVSSPAYAAKFKPSNSTNLVLGYTTSFFWVKFKLTNNSDVNLILEIAQAGLPDCDLYYKNKSDSLIIYKAGSNTYFHDRIIKSSFQAFPLEAGTQEYYVRLSTNSGPIPVNIYNQKVYEEKSVTQLFVYGIYLGLMLFVILSNLFFFYSMRNNLYLANALNVLIFTCFSMVVVDGFIVYFFPKVDMLFWYTTIPPIGVTLQTIYSLWFLEVKKYRPKIFNFSVGIIAIYIVWFILKFFLSFPIVQPINTVQALLSFFIMGYIGIKVGQSGNRFGYYFALTYIIYFLLVLAEATYVNTGSPAYIIGMSYSGHATVIEALALSFLLTQRFEWEKEEIERAKIEAQEKLIEKTLENEKIVKDQNVYLEDQVNLRTEDLERSLKGLKDTQAQLIQSEKMASLVLLTAGVAHEIQNPLNFVNNFSEINTELIDELETGINQGDTEEVKELLQVIKQNEMKIFHHGKRADTIVKGMLQHAKSSSGVMELTDINELCDEYIRLSYNGLRAKDKMFNASYKTEFDTSIPMIKIIPQDIGRVILNLLTNAFHTVSEKNLMNIEGYEPLVLVKTRLFQNHVEIRVKDNGNGIPKNVINKIFQPFFTTKPTGQGTGLGLSLSYDIVTKGHNGELSVLSEEGVGSTFIIILPT